MLASDNRFYNFDYIVERERGTHRGRVRSEPLRAGEFSVYGLSVYDVEQASWRRNSSLDGRFSSWGSGGQSATDQW